MLPADVEVLADDGSRILLEVRAPGRRALALADPRGDDVYVTVYDFAQGDEALCRASANWLVRADFPGLVLDPHACGYDRSRVVSSVPRGGQGGSGIHVREKRHKDEVYAIVELPGPRRDTEQWIWHVTRSTRELPYDPTLGLPLGYTVDALAWGVGAPILLPDP